MKNMGLCLYIIGVPVSHTLQFYILLFAKQKSFYNNCIFPFSKFPYLDSTWECFINDVRYILAILTGTV